MVEENITSPRKVIAFARYHQDRASGKAPAFTKRLCRHCGAPLLDGENEDECSSAFNPTMRAQRSAPRRFVAD